MHHLLDTYGAWIVAFLVGLECTGVPVPGETILVSAAIYAGTTQRLGIVEIITAGVAGAIAGNVIGYMIGRTLGYRLLVRYGAYIRLTEPRLRIGQYLFRRYGVVILVVARFLPVLRAIAALLAGANRMPLGRFMAGTVIGGAIWAPALATTAYLLGKEIRHVSTPVTVGLVVLAGLLVAGVALLIARNEKRLQEAADRDLADKPL
jgi:membrane protein DedA with SNARE-associated domain